MHFPDIIFNELNSYYASLKNMCCIGISDIENEPDKFDMNIYILNNSNFEEHFTITGVERANILDWYDNIAYLIEYAKNLIKMYEDQNNEALEYITIGLRILVNSLEQYWCVFVCNDNAEEPALIGKYEQRLNDLAVSTNIRNYINTITGKIFDQELYTSLVFEMQVFSSPYLYSTEGAIIN